MTILCVVVDLNFTYPFEICSGKKDKISKDKNIPQIYICKACQIVDPFVNYVKQIL